LALFDMFSMAIPHFRSPSFILHAVHGIPWKTFHENHSMEFPWKIFHGIPRNQTTLKTPWRFRGISFGMLHGITMEYAFCQPYVGT